VAGVLDVKNADVIGSGDDGAVVGVGHELDGKDVTLVARLDGSGQAELRSRRFGMVRVDVDAVVIGAGRK